MSNLSKMPRVVTFRRSPMDALERVMQPNNTEAWAFADRLVRESKAVDIVSIKLAGMEPITARELAERRARTSLKPTKPQEPCDVGLFGDESSQLDLVDLTRRDGRGTTRGL